MTIAIAKNPSRGTFWWELYDQSGAILLLGPVCHSEAEADTAADSVRKAVAKASQ